MYFQSQRRVMIFFFRQNQEANIEAIEDDARRDVLDSARRQVNIFSGIKFWENMYMSES